MRICISIYHSLNYLLAISVITRSTSGPRTGGEAISLYYNGIATLPSVARNDNTTINERDKFNGYVFAALHVTTIIKAAENQVETAVIRG
jgi:hypothetical protein